MNSKKPRVCLIILAYNGIELTLDVLDCISRFKTDGIDAETVVVDNASKDDTVKKLKGYSLPNMPFKLIENRKNLGFAGGNNVGIKDALKRGFEYVLLLNNDIYFLEDLLETLLKEIDSSSKIGMVCPKIYFAKGYEFHKERYSEKDLGKVIWYAGGEIDRKNIYSSHRGVDEVDKGQFDKKEETDFVNGACVLIKAEVFKKIGFLDERLFLYWEDVDFSERARRNGWKIIYTPETRLWHKVSVAAGGPGGETNDYFLTRNRLIFGFRYSSLRTKIALMRDSFRLMLKGRKWQKKGVVDFYLGNWGKGSRIK